MFNKNDKRTLEHSCFYNLYAVAYVASGGLQLMILPLMTSRLKLWLLGMGEANRGKVSEQHYTFLTRDTGLQLSTTSAAWRESCQLF